MRNCFLDAYSLSLEEVSERLSHCSHTVFLATALTLPIPAEMARKVLLYMYGAK